MNEIIFRNSPVKGLTLILASSVFVMTGIWLLEEESGFMTWFFICFFGLGGVVGLVQLFDRRIKIRITRDGIWDQTTRQDMVQWGQIKKVRVINIYGSCFIPLVLDDTFVFSGRQYRWAAWLNQRIRGEKVNINLASIKCNPYKLAAFIEAMSKAEPAQRNALIDNYRKELKIK